MGQLFSAGPCRLVSRFFRLLGVGGQGDKDDSPRAAAVQRADVAAAASGTSRRSRNVSNRVVPEPPSVGYRGPAAKNDAAPGDGVDGGVEVAAVAANVEETTQVQQEVAAGAAAAPEEELISPSSSVARVAGDLFRAVGDSISARPEDVRKKSIKQFGVPLRDLPATAVSDVMAPVPDILIRLQDCFLKLGGLREVGVFRLSCDPDEMKRARERIDTLGAASPLATADIVHVHCAAVLIKAFFRELPVHVLSAISLEDIQDIETGAAAWELVQSRVGAGERAALTYLLDLCARVERARPETKMTASAMGKVLAPNLFAPLPEGASRAVLVSFFRRVGRFVELLITHRGDDGELVDMLRQELAGADTTK